MQEKLHIPAYFLAEWMAENWWALLFEPRKSEDRDDVLFHSRHSIIHAQHGFALPDVQFEPFGDSVQVLCKGREVPATGVRFKNTARTVMSRAAVEIVLRKFVDASVERLHASAIKDTPLQRAWQSIQATADDQRQFCELVGALGVNPYSASADLARAVDQIFDALGQQAATDICMAATEEDVLSVGAVAGVLASKLEGPHQVTLAPLDRVHVSPDGAAHPSWRRGKKTAMTVRSSLGINPKDAQGSDKFFDCLKISTAGGRLSNLGGEDIFSGAIDRRGSDAAIVLPQQHEEARRFAASRAVFLGMTSGTSSRRLVTDAMIRDQQASRAFAAEILVPSDDLRAQSRDGRLSRDAVLEIARQRRASVKVVMYQASNNGLVAQASF